MESELCCECKKNPIYNKGRKLCKQCYSKLRYEALKGGRIELFTVNRRELLFESEYFHKQMKPYYYEPAIFQLGSAGTYKPDYYDIKDNVWIEVVGSRQAYHRNKEKYALFVKLYPMLKLELRLVNGELLFDDDNKRISNNLAKLQKKS